MAGGRGKAADAEDPMALNIQDLYAAGALLGRVAVRLTSAQRPELSQATAEIGHLVTRWAALLRAQHERLATLAPARRRFP